MHLTMIELLLPNTLTMSPNALTIMPSRYTASGALVAGRDLRGRVFVGSLAHNDVITVVHALVAGDRGAVGGVPLRQLLLRSLETNKRSSLCSQLPDQMIPHDVIEVSQV